MKFRIMYRNITAVLIYRFNCQNGKIMEEFHVPYYIRGKKLETHNKQKSLNYMQWMSKE